MEPPLPAPPLAAAAAPPQTQLGYPDSVDSSPRSRNTDSWDESVYQPVAKLRLMCSYGGHIVPRPHSKSLCYVGGDTRIVVVDRHTNLSDLADRLSKTLFDGRSFTLKYQLPNEDLDSLISVTTDEDLENMVDEYDRLSAAGAANKSSRLRLFLFPSKPDSASSIGSLLENSAKSDDWFLNALNGTTSGFSESASVNCLLGLDDDSVITPNANSSVKDVEAQIESFGNVKGVSGGGSKHGGQDVHSVPDSPMLETTSSFGSASSSPSLGNLPPIRVHVEDQNLKVGIEEQFSQMSVLENNVQQKQDDGGFVVLSSPPPVLSTFAATAATAVSRVPMNSVPPQLQQKQTVGLDLPSPDSVSSDGSITNPLSHKKPMIYQEPIVQIPSGNNRASPNPVVDQKITDQNTLIQMQQQLQDSGYLLPTQFDPQLHQQQQFIHPGAQYIHHHPTGAMPMPSYYPIYPSHQQHHPHQAALDQQYPVYYMPARQPQAYVQQQPNYSEAATANPSSRPQTLPPVSMVPPPPTAYNPSRNAPASKPEMASAVYRTATTAAPSMVQVPSSQHQPQYVGYSQIHHPSQSIAPNSAASVNYAFEYTDPTQHHLYYTQPLAPQLAAQYQTMTSASPEATAHLPAENMKQQVRTLQP